MTGPSGTAQTPVELLRADYDRTPYVSDAFAQSAPGRLAAIAHVFGLRTPEVATARVLEIGCAAGGNLFPFAAGHPGARAVGVDLSGVQIDLGRARAAALGLDNVDLLTADLATLDWSALGTFDYVVAHGVYSWVPPEVRDALLRTIRAVLRPAGVAYVSYNAYPGWKSKEVMRDAMMLASGASPTPAARAADAREVAGFLAEVVPADGVLSRVLAEFTARDADFGDPYLLHDELEAFNAPCYFYEFLGHAQRHGLTFLAEAHPEGMFPANSGPRVAEYLAAKCAGVQVLVEQYLDFVVNRSFRETLLVHDARSGEIRYDMAPERFRALHVAARSPVVGGPTVLDRSRQEYQVADGATLFTNDPGLKAALETLNDRWPWTTSRDDLVAEVRRRLGAAGTTPSDAIPGLVDELLGVLFAQGNGQFRPTALGPAAPGPAPTLPALPEPIRRMAESARAEPDSTIFNSWHEPLLPTPMDRRVLPLLDGTRDRAALRAAVFAGDGVPNSSQDSSPDAEELDAYLDGLVARLRELKLA